MNHQLPQSEPTNSKSNEQTEVIERWVAGGATEYSVDGGRVWWSKEQFKAAQRAANLPQLKEKDSDV